MPKSNEGCALRGTLSNFGIRFRFGGSARLIYARGLTAQLSAKPKSRKSARIQLPPVSVSLSPSLRHLNLDVLPAKVLAAYALLALFKV